MILSYIGQNQSQPPTATKEYSRRELQRHVRLYGTYEFVNRNAVQRDV